MRIVMFIVCVLMVAPALAAPPATRPVEFDTIKEAFPDQTTEKDGVVTLAIPRPDLDLTMDGDSVPASVAASIISFWNCPCGRLLVTGQFCVADYESNDVIDALRQDQFKIASVAPMLLMERPRMVLIRFQSGGRAPELIKTIKTALEWTGPARMAPATRPAR